MERLAIRLLGKPELSFDGNVLKWKAPPKAFPLLAMLALHRGRGLARRQLAVALWPDDLESNGLTKLRRHLYHVNRLLPALENIEWISQTREFVVWNETAPAWFDVRAFRAAIDSSRHHDAVELYRGDLLEDSYDEVIVEQRELLRTIYVEALSKAARALREARDFPLAIDYAEKLLACDEWNEGAVREWMAAKYESGDRSAALAMYERFARRLRDEFSVEPTEETLAVRETIRSGLPIAASVTQVIARRLDSGRGWTLPFVARDSELASLGGVWSRAARGTGATAFVFGEAGIGKSRLVAELAALVERQGGLVLAGTTSMPETEPYQAVLGALRAALPLLTQGSLDAVWLSALSRVLPEVRALREDLDADPAVERAQLRLFDALARAFDTVARKRPLCVLLEDVHWAGQATIDFLASLARRVGTMPVLLVATYRSEETPAGNPLRRLRAALVSEGRALAVPLARISKDDVLRLVEARVPDIGERAAVGDAVARLSEGNPLFAGQLLEGYFETGTIPGADATSVIDVKHTIAARMARVAPNVRTVAEIAACAGEVFRADIVADAGGLNENAVLDALGTLMDRGLVREAGGTALYYAFSHALIAATIYDESSASVRAARHRRIADLLEREFEGGTAAAVSIARHWKAAGEPERACSAYLRAAQLAARLYARADAVAFAREALALAAGERQRSEAAFAVANTEALLYRYVGDRVRQRAAIDAMMEMTAGGGAGVQRGIALHALGSFYHLTSQLDQALAPLQKALEIALAHDRHDDAIDIHFRMAYAYASLARYDDARREIASIERSPAGSTAYAHTLAARARIALAISRQDVTSAAPVARELLDVARATEDLEGQVQALTALGWAMQGTADANAIRRTYREAVDVAERLNFQQGATAAIIDLGQFEASVGNYDAAVELFDRVIATLSGQPEVFYGFCITNRARALYARGALTLAHGAALHAWDVARTVGVPRLQAAADLVLGMTLFHTGERERALELMAAALQKRRDIGTVPGLADVLNQYARALLACGQQTDALAVLDQLQTLYAPQPQGLEFEDAICELLARGAALRGDDVAAAAFRERAAMLVARDLALLPDEADRHRYLRRYQ